MIKKYNAGLIKVNDGATIINGSPGETIPNSGTTNDFGNKIYFNTDLDATEVFDRLSSIITVEAPNIAILAKGLAEIPPASPDGIFNSTTGCALVIGAVVLKPSGEAARITDITIDYVYSDETQKLQSITVYHYQTYGIDPNINGWKLPEGQNWIDLPVSEEPLVTSAWDMMPVGNKNDLLNTIVYINPTISKFSLSGNYDGAKVISENPIDLRPLIAKKKIPLDIEVEEKPVVIECISKNIVPNTGTTDDFGNKIYFNIEKYNSYESFLPLIEANPEILEEEYFLLAGTKNNQPNFMLVLILSPLEQLVVLTAQSLTEGQQEGQQFLAVFTKDSSIFDNIPVPETAQNKWNETIFTNGTNSYQLNIGVQLNDVVGSPSNPIIVGQKNKALEDLVYIQEEESIKISGKFDGTGIKTDKNVDLRSLLAQNKLPLDIEVPKPVSSTACVDSWVNGTVINSGTGKYLRNNKVNINSLLKKQEVIDILASLNWEQIKIDQENNKRIAVFLTLAGPYPGIYGSDTMLKCIYITKYSNNRYTINYHYYQKSANGCGSGAINMVLFDSSIDGSWGQGWVSISASDYGCNISEDWSSYCLITDNAKFYSDASKVAPGLTEQTPVGQFNEQLINLFNCTTLKANCTSVTLNGNYDGNTVKVTDNINMQNFINDKKLPLHINICPAKVHLKTVIPNSGTATRFKLPIIDILTDNTNTFSSSTRFNSFYSELFNKLPLIEGENSASKYLIAVNTAGTKFLYFVIDKYNSKVNTVFLNHSDTWEDMIKSSGEYLTPGNICLYSDSYAYDQYALEDLSVYEWNSDLCSSFNGYQVGIANDLITDIICLDEDQTFTIFDDCSTDFMQITPDLKYIGTPIPISKRITVEKIYFNTALSKEETLTYLKQISTTYPIFEGTKTIENIDWSIQLIHEGNDYYNKLIYRKRNQNDYYNPIDQIIFDADTETGWQGIDYIEVNSPNDAFNYYDCSGLHIIYNQCSDIISTTPFLNKTYNIINRDGTINLIPLLRANKVPAELSLKKYKINILIPDTTDKLISSAVIKPEVGAKMYFNTTLPKDYIYSLSNLNPDIYSNIYGDIIFKVLSLDDTKEMYLHIERSSGTIKLCKTKDYNSELIKQIFGYDSASSSYKWASDVSVDKAEFKIVDIDSYHMYLKDLVSDKPFVPSSSTEINVGNYLDSTWEIANKLTIYHQQN